MKILSSIVLISLSFCFSTQAAHEQEWTGTDELAKAKVVIEDAQRAMDELAKV